MNKPMSPKTEAALVTVALALIGSETGELAEHELEALKGVGLPQLRAAVERNYLARRQGTFVPTTGPYAGQELPTTYYSAA